VPFFSNDKRETGLAVGERVKILMPDKSDIFIYFRPRDLDFPRVIELGLLLFLEKRLKEGNIPWEKD
jgi:hypothetical protein